MVNYRPQSPDVNGGLVECYGTGMGFNIWRLAMFKDARIKKPWFKTLNGKDGLPSGHPGFDLSGMRLVKVRLPMQSDRLLGESWTIMI